jgi:hypothetical protein
MNVKAIRLLLGVWLFVGWGEYGKDKDKSFISFWIAAGLHPHIWGEPLAMTANCYD